MSQAGNARRRDREAGFTVIEMIAVLALIALVSGLFISAMPARKSASNLKAVAVEIATQLRNARTDAINRQRQNVVIFDIGRHIIDVGPGRKIMRLDRDVSITLNTADSEHRTTQMTGIRFFQNGSSTGGTLQLKRNNRTYEIRVNWLNGRVRLRRLAPQRS